ncbi:RNA polymerase sigma-70 factor [Mucilaginibacter sp. SP1R1]|uniref:RNA polymerase sigma-70 factor n=1 Tax=Mucilaginibacter sp. SP1R1 TaxID=2723091 RepID=UPI001621A8E0|nr:RNA polymerase sigma-70 factor [Mucilaginibacter sp. SP1R1]MBB6147676.1 RNA polymerase sigma-70 factor (ECF subfamily) [Mucilaginibacter sp. SP1R1]
MKKLCGLSDNELVEFLGQDNIAAFEEIYNRYWLKLYAAAYKRLNEREVAREIVQDFFTNFWVNRAQIKIQSSLEGYFFTAIKYQVLNYKRAEAVRSSYSKQLQLANEVYDNSIEENYQYKELRERVDMEVNQLPPKCRFVFELSRNQYKTNKEIAQLLGISEKTVENHLTKALRYLRVNLNILFILFLFR